MDILSGLVFTSVIVTVTLDCKYFRTRIVSGKDLFRAKTIFGTLIRGCKREADQVARVIPVNDFGKRLEFYCQEYVKCRGLVNTSQELVNCGRMELMNKSSPVHVEMHEPLVLTQAGEEFLSCSLRVGMADITLEDFDNAVTFTYNFFMKYG